MISLLSSITGSFGKNIILGMFLPSVIFVLLFILLDISIPQIIVEPFKELKNITNQPESEKVSPEWIILTLTFVTVVISAFLYTANEVLIRLYSGYSWEKSWIGKRRKKSWEKYYTKLKSKHDGLRTLLRKLNKIKYIADEEQKKAEQKKLITNIKSVLTEEKKIWRIFGVRSRIKEIEVKESGSLSHLVFDEWLNEIQKGWDEIGWELRKNFPDKMLIQSTELGNVIRSVDNYPKVEYGMDGVELQNILLAKVDKEYLALIDDNKTKFDFFFNMSFLMLLLALIQFFISILFGSFETFNAIGWLIFKVLVILIVSYIFYQLAVNQVKSWGATVKGAFDLYRKDLLTQLGFAEYPKSKLIEKDLWTGISKQIIYGDRPGEGHRFDYEDLTTFVVVGTEIKNKEMTVLRGCSSKQTNEYEITITVKNNMKKAAEKVVVMDRLPSTYIYLWDSAIVERTSNNAELPFIQHPKLISTNANQYKFEVGRINSTEEIKLKYVALSTG